MKKIIIRKQVYGLTRNPAIRLLLIAGLAALPIFAQSPFTAPITAIQTFSLQISRIIGVVVIVFGGARAAMGGHRAEGITEMLFGVGMMAYAQQVVTWLFP